MNRWLIAECAFEMAREMTSLIAHNYRDEELRDVFEAFREKCKQGLEAYATQADRMQHRLKPLEN